MVIRALMLSTALVIPMSMPASAQAALTPAEGAQSTAATAVSVTDPAEFAALATSSNLFEIHSSELALQRSQNEEVRAFAQRMIEDHTAASQRMAEAAQQDGLTMPNAIAQRHQDMLNQLSAQQGDAFDAAYLQAQLQAHEEAVALFESFAAAGTGGALNAFAAETVPTLQAHYEMVSTLAGSQGQGGNLAQANQRVTQQQGSTAVTTTTTATSPTTQQGSGGGFITQQEMNQLMGTNLMDAQVIGVDGESIGPVEDVLLDAEGRILAVIVNVGGFLGIGSRNVAIDVNSLQILVAGARGEAGITSAAPNPAVGTAGEGIATPGVAPTAAPGAGTAITPGVAAPGAPGTGLGGATTGATGWGAGWGEMGQIQSIVVDFTREQIENAPEFMRLQDVQ